MPERSILAVTSKIVSLCEGNAVSQGEITKDALVKREATHYIDPRRSRWGITLTVTRNILIPSAGIDESNADGTFLLWPKNPQKTADTLRAHLARRFQRQKVGVIITDSTTTPLRRGTTGIALAHSGFDALKDYVGKKDLFGRPFKVSRLNVMNCLASAAVGVMGEGSERTPLALISEIPSVRFVQRNPSPSELAFLTIAPKDDLYAPLLKNAPWKRGGGGKG
jgi:F420-0:gamma-glutamyl ligase